MPELALTDSRLLFLNPSDNVCTAIAPIPAGVTLRIKGNNAVTSTSIPLGFKVAACSIPIGDKIFKYGVPIGSATRNIAPGDLVHLHNIKSDYLPTYTLDKKQSHDRE